MAEFAPVKYAAVGCGGMGRRHLRGFGALHHSSAKSMLLVACVDTNIEAARFYAKEALDLYGLEVHPFASVAEMKAAMPEVEAVDVTTDTGSHHRAVMACLEQDLHVLCEKPLAITTGACDLVIAEANRRGRVLSVAENFRRDPINRLIRALIDDGAIGEPRLMIETTIGGANRIVITPWRHMKHTGAITLDEGVHHADILRYYLGEVHTIYGETRLHEKVRVNTRSAGPGGFYAQYVNAFPDTIEPTGEDAIYAHLRFDRGTVAHWVNDHAGHGRGQSGRFVYGSKGSIDSPGDRNGRPVTLHLTGHDSITGAEILDHAPSYRLDSLASELFGGDRVWTFDFEFNVTDAKIMALELHELASCIRTGARPEVDGEEGRRDVALTYAPFESGRLGRAVTLDEVLQASHGPAYAYQGEIDRQIGLL